MKSRVWVVLGVVTAGIVTPRAADACGAGGVVSTSRSGSVGSNAQRVILAVDEGAASGSAKTDVVVQLGVPETTESYGALLPVPSEPTLDPNPISASELDQLDEATAPTIVSQQGTSGSSGCGCGAVGAANDKNGEQPGVRASAPVNIGPVTAVTLAGTAAAVSAWLGENGFTVGAADQEMIARYENGYNGGYFIAIRRNEAVTYGPSSVGVHFTMAGDHRGLSLRFASLGAPATVAFTVFLVTNETTGPSAPFTALTLDSLNPEIIRHAGYAQAVRGAVQANGNRTFVIESSTPVSELPSLSAKRFFTGSTVTRLTTVLPSSALTVDAVFDTPFEQDVPSVLFVQSSVESGYRTASMASLPALLLLGLARRRRRRTASF
jgi:hypothetical protein